MNIDPIAAAEDPFAEDDIRSAIRESSAAVPPERTHLLILGLSGVLALAALIAAFVRSSGYVLFAVAVVAYLLAVLADLVLRRTRFQRGKFGRSVLTVSWRAATFVSALVVAWLAASTLAGA